MPGNPCSVAGCDKDAARRGLCHMHYKRLQTYGTTDLPARPPRPEPGPCAVDGCEKQARNLAPSSTCWAHYQRWRKYGTYDDPRPPTNPVCGFDGCEEPPRTRVSDYCAYHYDQWVRGHELRPRDWRATDPRRRVEADGTPRPCRVDGCDKPVKGRGLCSMHWWRWTQHGSYEPPRAPFQGVKGEAHPAWHGDGIGYNGMHQRLRARLGRAGTRTCSMCWTEPAADWAFVGVPTERRSWSTNEDLYVPLCKLCHKNLDDSLRGLYEGDADPGEGARSST